MFKTKLFKFAEKIKVNKQGPEGIRMLLFFKIKNKCLAKHDIANMYDR